MLSRNQTSNETSFKCKDLYEKIEKVYTTFLHEYNITLKILYMNDEDIIKDYGDIALNRVKSARSDIFYQCLNVFEDSGLEMHDMITILKIKYILKWKTTPHKKVTMK